MYKHYCSKYYSPTINLQMSPNDYIKFCQNLNYYLNQDIIEVKNPDDSEFRKLGGGNITFPVGKLGDLIIYFQHFKTFNQAVSKWNERKQRINYDNMFFILLDVNCSKNNVEDFLNLPYKNKIFLSNNKNLLIDKNCFYIDFQGKAWFESTWKKQFNFKKWFLEN